MAEFLRIPERDKSPQERIEQLRDEMSMFNDFYRQDPGFTAEMLREKGDVLNEGYNDFFKARIKILGGLVRVQAVDKDLGMQHVFVDHGETNGAFNGVVYIAGKDNSSARLVAHAVVGSEYQEILPAGGTRICQDGSLIDVGRASMFLTGVSNSHDQRVLDMEPRMIKIVDLLDRYVDFLDEDDFGEAMELLCKVAEPLTFDRATSTDAALQRHLISWVNGALTLGENAVLYPTSMAVKQRDGSSKLATAEEGYAFEVGDLGLIEPVWINYKRTKTSVLAAGVSGASYLGRVTVPLLLS